MTADIRNHEYTKTERRNKKRLSVALYTMLILTCITGWGIYKAGSTHVPYAGKYTKGNFYVELTKSGEFTVSNYVSLKGRYDVIGQEILFYVQNVNDTAFQSTVKGKLNGNKLVGPDKIEYVKEEP